LVQGADSNKKGRNRLLMQKTPALGMTPDGTLGSDLGFDFQKTEAVLMEPSGIRARGARRKNPPHDYKNVSEL